MLRDFSKLNTFLTVVREKSFSKASKKLGISQPAVTQQIKLLESYMKTGIVDRKKNGIGLTKEGEELYRIALKLEKFINNTEKDIMRIIDKKITFIIGATSSIGKYIVPTFLGDIKDAIDNDVKVKIGSYAEITKALHEKKVDLVLAAECNTTDNSLIYKEWLEDELVFFSKAPLPKLIKKEQLFDFKWITREDESPTRQTIIEKMTQADIDYNSFDVASVISSTTAIKQTILKTKVAKKPLIAVACKHALEDEIKSGKLYISKIRNIKLRRKIYLVYRKDDKNEAFVGKVANYISSIRKL